MAMTKARRASSAHYSLDAIAEKMKETAVDQPNGQVYRRLARGLHVVFARVEGRCRLAIGREAPALPSHEEMVVVGKAFGVPAGTMATLREAQWQNPVTERCVTFNVLEVRWRDYDERI